VITGEARGTTSGTPPIAYVNKERIDMSMIDPILVPIPTQIKEGADMLSVRLEQNPSQITQSNARGEGAEGTLPTVESRIEATRKESIGSGTIHIATTVVSGRM
jgi:hypothetical protein